MKILISPSKTQKYRLPENFSKEWVESFKKHEENKRRLEIKDEIEKILLKNQIEFKNLKVGKEESLIESPAIFTYTGLVFKQLSFMSYDKKCYEYMKNHIRILSALYGILSPYDMIKPYRLDFTVKIKSINLYDVWNGFVKEYFKNGEPVINLASNEFSKMVSIPKITIHFRQLEDGVYKNKATYGKMARGQMLNFMILNKVDSINEVKNISFDGYIFDEKMSDGENLYFLKNF